MVWTGDHRGRLAPALVRMVDEADTLAPGRDTASDGSIGDQAHQARRSHHNLSVPDANGNRWVDALDLTHDPAGGWDCSVRVQQILAARDPRIEYVIWNRTIWRAYKHHDGHPKPWTGETYRGSNTHTRHMHVSVWRDHRRRITAPWWPEQEDTDVTNQQAVLLAYIALGLTANQTKVDEWTKMVDDGRATQDDIFHHIANADGNPDT